MGFDFNRPPIKYPAHYATLARPTSVADSTQKKLLKPVQSLTRLFRLSEFTQFERLGQCHLGLGLVTGLGIGHSEVVVEDRDLGRGC